MGSAALLPPPGKDQDLQAPAERLHPPTRAPPPRVLSQGTAPPGCTPPELPAPQQEPHPTAPLLPNQSPRRAQLPQAADPPYCCCGLWGPYLVLITRGSCRFTPFLGTGYYFLIPINTYDSIYVQDKFISISFFN